MNLSQFCGTENYYKSSMFAPKMMHTDGVQYFCEEGGAFWFLDIVSTEIYPLPNPFISIVLVSHDNHASIFATDGNEKEIFTKHIEYTDLPSGTYQFFLTDNVLMLTSEY